MRIVQDCMTIQGEGETAGTPVLLIRFGECQLNCPFCDTKQLNERYDNCVNLYNINDTIKFCDYLKKEYFDRYPVNNIMITGGEPFIYYETIHEIINHLINFRSIKTIEIETNGLLITTFKLLKVLGGMLDKFNLKLNISPKLDRNCYPNPNRLGISGISDVIDRFLTIEKDIQDAKKEDKLTRSYKFVYDYQNYECGQKIINFCQNVGINYDDVSIIPLTDMNITDQISSTDKEISTNYVKVSPTKNFFNEFRRSCIETVKFCIKNNFRFSSREQIWLFGKNKSEIIFD